MKKLEAIKAVTGFVISIGVGNIISNAVKATTPCNSKILNRVCTLAGVIVLSSIIGDIATKYAEEKITSAVKSISDMAKDQKETII